MTSLDRRTNGAPGAPEPDPAGPKQAPPEPDEAATKAAFFEAFGGVRGMIETTVPGLVFVLSYTLNRDLNTSAILALSITGVMFLLRLVQRGPTKHAFSGVFGVVIGAVFAMMTGDARNFYLPGMIYTLVLGIAYTVSAALGFPLLGLILGPLFKENLSWRTRNPGRKRAYVKASYVWGAILLAKSAITFPIYFWGDAAQLGWLRVALGIPPFLLAVYLTWIIMVKAPAPIDVIAEMEAEERREQEREREREEERARAAARAAGTAGTGP
ncbi:DUF3159 domain-containing protein [Streptomyces alkaliphilus]|uniref:DUF3159 domain-containing protein n=1 Tax=Streptomyces alkaliphilus TaxID=1472722 RepID=A0A7W3TB83_9ACTN|nr:DUF3159 domain-containing protein [Streptomyces alkaliphilus]MBB0243608.1 DUF3159 domain-containing protein [Streptomyces alkaliphilus]